MSGKTSAAFVAYAYEKDYREIQKLLQQYPNIETGGDLFGLWKNENTVVIQLFIGPGKKCERTTTSFHQDIDYLKQVGSLVTKEEGLCNVGEWHSHHQIGMPEPSAADCRTVFNNMPQLGLERFVLFIASIESKHPTSKKRVRDRVELERIKLRCFLFLGSERKVVSGSIKIISGENPHTLCNKARREIQSGKETPPIEDPETKLSKSSDENSPRFSAPQQPKGKNAEKAQDEITSSQRATGERDLAEEKDQLKLTRQTNEEQPKPNVQRNTKLKKHSGTASPVQSDEARKVQNDQKHCVEVQSPSKTFKEVEPNQLLVRTVISKENWPPNTALPPPPVSPPASQPQYSNTSPCSATEPTWEPASPQGNFSQPTSRPTFSTTLQHASYYQPHSLSMMGTEQLSQGRLPSAKLQWTQPSPSSGQPATKGLGTPGYVPPQRISSHQYTGPLSSGNREYQASMQHPKAYGLDRGYERHTVSHASPTPQMMQYPSSHPSPVPSDGRGYPMYMQQQQPTAKSSSQNRGGLINQSNAEQKEGAVLPADVRKVTAGGFF